jgi:hypothetical protein
VALIRTIHCLIRHVDSNYLFVQGSLNLRTHYATDLHLQHETTCLSHYNLFLKKLTGPQVAQKIIPAFDGARNFITAFTASRHLSLSWADEYSLRTYPTSKTIETLSFPSTPISFKWSISLRLPHQKPACTYLPPIHATSPAHLTDDVSTKCNYRSITSFSKWNK